MSGKYFMIDLKPAHRCVLRVVDSIDRWAERRLGLSQPLELHGEQGLSTLELTHANCDI